VRGAPRIGRVPRLRRYSVGVSALPADVATIIGLSPHIYLDVRYPSLHGIGTVLHTDSGRTTPVAVLDDPIGSARNLGSLGGYAVSSGTERPIWKQSAGAQWDRVDDRLDLDVTLIAQPITVVMWFRQWAWQSSNEYPMDSKLASTTRFDAFGRGSVFGSFPNDHHLTATSTLVRLNWGLTAGTDIGNTRAILVANGSSSSVAYSGGWTYSSGSINPGTSGLDGMVWGRKFLGPNMRCTAVAVFARALSSGDIAALPATL
jgi:hypothetical protein